jgi:hypothetical protein
MRVPAPVHDCHDDDVVGLHTKIDSERKARHQSATRISMHDGTLQRLCGDSIESGQRLVKKLVP